MSWFLLAVALVPLTAAVLLAVTRAQRATAAPVAVGISAVAFAAAVVTLVAAAVDGRVDAVLTDGDGVAVVGLTADRVGGILIVLTTAVGVIAQSFASRSLQGDPRAARFHGLALGLTAATSTVAVAATASLLVVAWLATSTVLVALIAHRSPWPAAQAARRRAAWSFALGDAVLVIALVVIVTTIGDIDMRAVGAAARELDADRVGPLGVSGLVAVLLVLAGIARSALVPVHRWLPATLAAPTPVSALLHAGVINGAGVLLLRFSPVFASSVAAMSLAFAVGLVTALLATSVMLVRTDVKGALVWSTSGQMGFMVLQLGVGAFAAALFHIVGHALYKAALFLGAGGAITAHARQHRRPHLGMAAASTLQSAPVAVGVGLVAPVAAFATALFVIDPHLTPGAVILVVTFGALSVGRAANGWARSAPWSAAPTLVAAVAGVTVAAWAYVAGIALFEHFVAAEVPYDVPAAVGPVWVAASLLVVAVAAAAVTWIPGSFGDGLRRRVYAWLQSTGSPAIPRRADGSVARRPARAVPIGSPPNATNAAEPALPTVGGEVAGSVPTGGQP
jgi:NAD(P)H-quinone oxidoreductase subunit 5